MDPIASIEIGTNSVRMLIAEKGTSRTAFTPVLRKRVITRLGEGFNSDKGCILKPGAIAKTITALREFFGIASQFGVSSPLVIATGVVRKAANRDTFITSIAEHLGHKVRIISGQEEAELTEKGVLSSLDLASESSVVFDLGGGSTEFIQTNSKGTAYLSVELGVVVLKETFLTTDPPKDEEIWNLGKHIEDACKTRLSSLKESGDRNVTFIGAGGTVVTLAAMIHGITEDNFNGRNSIHGLSVKKHDIRLLFKKLKGMPAAERLASPGLESGREDIILPGTLMVMKFMDYFGKDEIIVSYSDLLEGILIQHVEGERYG
jgi:exopolyphosphatase/guanosine-5'-triphosphate,3'-diphosphate pyrophosphatase